jgi:hypothetical protein
LFGCFGIEEDEDWVVRVCEIRVRSNLWEKFDVLDEVMGWNVCENDEDV